MQVKTFTGATSQEVLARIKAEMGPEAVILGNRTYRRNGVVCHEITAGLERNESESRNQEAGAPAVGANGTRSGCRSRIRSSL